MKKLFICLFTIPLFCAAQNNSGYFQLSPTFNISKPLGLGIGGTIAAGIKVKESLSIGAGFDIIKYKNLGKTSPSVFADFRYYMGKGIKKPIPYFTLTPGYYFYNDQKQVGNYVFTSKGGFLIGAGLGCILYSGNKTAVFLSALYNSFPIKTESNLSKDAVTTNYNIAKVSIGINF